MNVYFNKKMKINKKIVKLKIKKIKLNNKYRNK